MFYLEKTQSSSGSDQLKSLSDNFINTAMPILQIAFILCTLAIMVAFAWFAIRFALGVNVEKNKKLMKYSAIGLFLLWFTFVILLPLIFATASGTSITLDPSVS